MRYSQYGAQGRPGEACPAIGEPRRLDGRLDPNALGAALRHGFCIVRWHLTQ